MTDAAAIAAYEKTLRGSNIYKYAESYILQGKSLDIILFCCY